MLVLCSYVYDAHLVHSSIMPMQCHTIFSVAAIEKQKSAHVYEDYSYDYTLVKPFSEKHDVTKEDDDVEVVESDKRRASSISFASTRKFTTGSKRNMRKTWTKNQSIAIRGM